MPTWNDPSPMANPFNSYGHGNFNTGRANVHSHISHTGKVAANLQVPNQDIPYNGSPEWYAMQRNNLQPPNQDIPLGDQCQGCGFLPGSDRLFRTSDGTIFDFKSKRIVRWEQDIPGYWGDPSRVIGMDNMGVIPQMTGGVSQSPSMAELINNIDMYKGTAMPDGSLMEPMDAKSAAYWLKAEEEASKLVANMSDEQKSMMAAFEAHFPKSKLIEESRKTR